MSSYAAGPPRGRNLRPSAAPAQLRRSPSSFHRPQAETGGKICTSHQHGDSHAFRIFFFFLPWGEKHSATMLENTAIIHSSGKIP